MLRLKGQYFGHLMWRADSFEKDLMPERFRAGGEGWMASPTQLTLVWEDSASWWWTGRPDMLQFMGSQRVRHAWVTELTELKSYWWLMYPHSANSKEKTFPWKSNSLDLKRKIFLLNICSRIGENLDSALQKHFSINCLNLFPLQHHISFHIHALERDTRSTELTFQHYFEHFPKKQEFYTLVSDSCYDSYLRNLKIWILYLTSLIVDFEFFLLIIKILISEFN